MLARKTPYPTDMTRDEFLAWVGDGGGGKVQLIEGRVVAMAPASTTHGTIQAVLSALLFNHLRSSGSPCRVVTEPGIDVRIRNDRNYRVPDLAVTCSPDLRGQTELPEPILLVEILSPSNAPETWSNVWAYATIPSVKQILVVHSSRVEAHLLTRQADGAWPHSGDTISADGAVDLGTIGLNFAVQEAYFGTFLA